MVCRDVMVGIQVTAENDGDRMLLAALEGLSAEGNRREDREPPGALFLCLKMPPDQSRLRPAAPVNGNSESSGESASAATPTAATTVRSRARRDRTGVRMGKG